MMRPSAFFVLLLPMAVVAMPLSILTLGLWLGPPLVIAAALLLARVFADDTRRGA